MYDGNGIRNLPYAAKHFAGIWFLGLKLFLYKCIVRNIAEPE